MAEHASTSMTLRSATSFSSTARSLSLHLFEHVHGESRERGQAMVDLMAMYENAGFEIGAKELPDYLPMFLEFLSTRPEEEARDLLGRTVHIFSALRERLRKRKSIYINAFRVLEPIARGKADPAIVAEILKSLTTIPTISRRSTASGRRRPSPSAAARATTLAGPTASAPRSAQRSAGPTPRHPPNMQPREAAMQDFLHNFVYGIYPYIAITILIVGTIVRYEREPYTWRSGSSQMLRRKQLVLGSVLFHIGVIVIFFDHLVGLLTPIELFDWMGVSHPSSRSPPSAWAAWRAPRRCSARPSSCIGACPIRAFAAPPAIATSRCWCCSGCSSCWVWDP